MKDHSSLDNKARGRVIPTISNLNLPTIRMGNNGIVFQTIGFAGFVYLEIETKRPGRVLRLSTGQSTQRRMARRDSRIERKRSSMVKFP